MTAKSKKRPAPRNPLVCYRCRRDHNDTGAPLEVSWDTDHTERDGRQRTSASVKCVRSHRWQSVHPDAVQQARAQRTPAAGPEKGAA